MSASAMQPMSAANIALAIKESPTCGSGAILINKQDADLTVAQFLASATRIAEFYVGCNDVNGVPIPCEISVKKIVFYNEDDQRFAIKKDVLQKSNKK